MGSRKINIGVILQSNIEVGGGFQYELTLALELKEMIKYNFYFFVFSDKVKNILAAHGIESILIKQKFIDKFIRYINRQPFTYQVAPKIKLISSFERILENYNIDLVYFLSPSMYAFDLIRHNYIITVWDLCHRDHPEFPEVNFYREFERREEIYTKLLKKAVAVITDNEYTMEKIVKWYGVEKDRIYIVPFHITPQSMTKREVNVREKYSIYGDYIYYPAQFWPHKNHIYIINALKILKDKGIKLTAVFSGSDKGYLTHVLRYAEQIGIADQIKYIGFVPTEDIYSLYSNALALVMPTYFGPTNLPPLEAFAIGVPVIYPDLEGLRQQVGDAALLCDLSNASTLAEKLYSLLYDMRLREELIKRGKEKLQRLLGDSNLSFTLEKILDNYIPKLTCWKPT